MKKYTVIGKFYVTSLTYNDSYMWKPDIGSILEHNEHTIYINGQKTIDQVGLVEILLRDACIASC